MKQMILSCVFLVCIGHSACKKFIEVDPPVTNVSGSNAYASDENAISVITGLYLEGFAAGMGIDQGFRGLSQFGGLVADEFAVNATVSDPMLQSFFTNNLLPKEYSYWGMAYEKIFKINQALEGLSQSRTLTTSVKNRLLGETLFFRGFYYFYLVNLYGEIPLNLTTDYKVNSGNYRTSIVQVYAQIIQDLEAASHYLTADYVNARMQAVTDRIRVNQYAALALLSRVYLYAGNYAKAEAVATSVIDQSGLYKLEPLPDVFLVNSQEVIWSIQSIDADYNTVEALRFILPASGPTADAGISDQPVYMTPSLSRAFEPGDQRFVQWVDSVVANGTTWYFPFKYKNNTLNSPVTERAIVLRLAEQYLIRAEARAYQDKINGAGSGSEDITVIRKRAGLGTINPTNRADLLAAILQERRVELFTQWGHRWLDLKRSGMADPVLRVEKGANWQSTDQLFPIPTTELQQNPAIRGHQNPGYD